MKILIIALSLVCVAHAEPEPEPFIGDIIGGVVNLFNGFKTPGTDVKLLGCFKDGDGSCELPVLFGCAKHWPAPRAFQGGFVKYHHNDVIKKCYEDALRNGVDTFAIQNGNECWANDKNGIKHYNKHGAGGALLDPYKCLDGRGGRFRNDVYHIVKTGLWSSWSVGSCSKSCGGGRRSKTRKCVGGTKCPGPSRADEDCNKQECPGNWGAWSVGACSKSCDGGRRSKTRKCVGGSKCPGSSRVDEDCNKEKCPLKCGPGKRPNAAGNACEDIPPQSPLQTLEWKMQSPFLLRERLGEPRDTWLFWRIKWDQFQFQFHTFTILSNGKVRVDHDRNKEYTFEVSVFPQFPKSQRWWTFSIKNFRYFFRMTFTGVNGVEMHKFSKNSECKKTFNGMANYCKQVEFLYKNDENPRGSGARWIMWYKRMIGTWNLWTNLKIKFLEEGKYEIEGKKFEVAFSDKPAFPLIDGWFRAEYKGFVYYFRVVFEGLEVHRFSVGANVNCKNTLKGLKNFCRTKIGSGAVKWASVLKKLVGRTLKINGKENDRFHYTLKIDKQRYVTVIDGAKTTKIRMTLPDVAFLPLGRDNGGPQPNTNEGNGYMMFHYNSYRFYIRFYSDDHLLQWWQFGGKYGKCEKNSWNSALGGHFCGKDLTAYVHECDRDNNGGCAQICEKKGQQKICKCNPGFNMLPDKTCKRPTTDPCKPWTERFPLELGAPSHARCTSNGDPHPVTFDGARYDFFKIGDWLMASSDRRDFEVHARTHKCWRVSCNCGVVVKEGQDVISVNYCGDQNNPYVGFLSKKEPLHGTGIEKSGHTYSISLASGAKVTLKVNMGNGNLWIDLTIQVPNFDFKHINGACGSWDKNAGNDGKRGEIEKWRRHPKDSLFFFKAEDEKSCLSAKLACNKDKKFKARPGWVNYLVKGQKKCSEEREEEDDPNSEELPDEEVDPNEGLPEDPENFEPVIPEWPTPTGKTEDDAKKHCEDKIKDTETYKACKRVLGGRFRINGALQQCVDDTQLTDSYEMAVPAAVDTMKTTCLDVADDEEEKKINGETCPDDCNNNGECVKGVCHCNAGFKGYDCSVAYTTAAPPTTQKPLELTYENFKDKECRTGKWDVKGCYDTKVPFKRGKLLVYWRHDIEWSKERHPSFARSMACVCAEAARRKGVKWFGLHFWGECWELDPTEIKQNPNGDCLLADGNYKTKCSKMNHRYGNYECLADQSYYVYKLK